MEYEDLIKLGFNRNEAKVYFSLIKLGKSDANRIIKDTKFHKNIVYDNLEKLIDKGLVSYILEKGKRHFKIVSPDMLVNFFEDKEKEIVDKKKQALIFSNEIKKMQTKVLEKQNASIYRGVKGIKSFYNETLSEIHNELIVFGAPQASVDIMGEIFWKNYEIKRAEIKLNARMIFNPSLRNYGEKISKKFTEVRYFDKDFEPLTETTIYGDKIAIIVWTEEPMLFLIEDKNVSKSYKDFFEKMWKLAKK